MNSDPIYILIYYAADPLHKFIYFEVRIAKLLSMKYKVRKIAKK